MHKIYYECQFAILEQKQSPFLTRSGPGNDLWQGRNISFLLGNGMRRDGGAESQSLIIVQI